MLQCKDCEFFRRLPDGTPKLLCDPFATIKEPECLLKWQLLELKSMAESHRATLEMHRRFAPMQEKLFRHMEREIDEAEETDRWKYQEGDDPGEDKEEPPKW